MRVIMYAVMSLPDLIINHSSKWFFAGIVLTLVFAIRDTPQIVREIGGRPGVKKAWPITNLGLHWLAVLVTTLGAIASQLGSERSDSEINRQSNALQTATQRLAQVQRQAEANDPMKQPITTVTAFLKME